MPGDDLTLSHSPPPSRPLAELLAGNVRCVELSGGRALLDMPRPGRIYLPGSFNPLHAGHRGLLAAAEAAAGRPGAGAFELSVTNADKVRQHVNGSKSQHPTVGRLY